MNTLKRYESILAIYPNTRGFAFVLFEGPSSPIDWGVRRIRGRRKNEQCLRVIGSILARHVPDAVVLQDTSPHGTRRSRRVIKLNEAIAELAERYCIPLQAYSRTQVRLAFGDLAFTSKHAIAEAIAKHIPAFERYLPPRRRLWMTEDARMGLFDAAALALTYFQSALGGELKPPE